MARCFGPARRTAWPGGVVFVPARSTRPCLGQHLGPWHDTGLARPKGRHGERPSGCNGHSAAQPLRSSAYISRRMRVPSNPNPKHSRPTPQSLARSCLVVLSLSPWLSLVAVDLNLRLSVTPPPQRRRLSSPILSLCPFPPYFPLLPSPPPVNHVSTCSCNSLRRRSPWFLISALSVVSPSLALWPLILRSRQVPLTLDLVCCSLTIFLPSP